MKVAFISYHWPEYSLRLVSALAAETQVCLLVPRPWGSHVDRLDHPVNFQPFDKPRIRQPVQQLRMIGRIRRVIKAFNPDVIHLQHGHLWLNLALPLLRQYPLVITIHDPRYHLGDKESQKTPQPIIDFGFRRAARVIVHTSQMAQMAVDEVGISAEKIDIVPMIQLGDAKAELDVQEDGHLVLFFGRIWEYKGLEYLIRAEPLITAAVPGAKIMIAGQGEDFARYERMMVNPQNFIVQNEYIPTEQHAALFRRASLVAMPYLEATQSAVIPIAYTFGKPVVATPVGGLPDQVQDGHTGFMVPPRDEQALAERIIQLLQDEPLRRRLGENGKRLIETELSANAVAQKTMAVYARAINGSG